MNSNSLNEYIKVAINRESEKNMSGKHYNIKPFVEAPLFLVEFPNAEFLLKDVENSREMIFNNEDYLCLPFPNVRVIDKTIHLGEYQFSYVFGSGNYDDNKSGFYAMCIANHLTSSCRCVTSITIVGSTDELKKLAVDSTDKIAAVVSYVEIKPLGRVLNAAQMDGKMGGEIFENSGNIIRRLFDFLSIVNCPRTFVTKVSPNQTGRSTEWIERKSHYIILSSEHNKQIVSGKKCSYDGKITRAMHNRRAHFRNLTSEKFTRKKGLKIWIKSSWVGPEEWSDKTGNSYKIITKNKTN